MGCRRWASSVLRVMPVLSEAAWRQPNLLRSVSAVNDPCSSPPESVVEVPAAVCELAGTSGCRWLCCGDAHKASIFRAGCDPEVDCRAFFYLFDSLGCAVNRCLESSATTLSPTSWRFTLNDGAHRCATGVSAVSKALQQTATEEKLTRKKCGSAEHCYRSTIFVLSDCSQGARWGIVPGLAAPRTDRPAKDFARFARPRARAEAVLSAAIRSALCRCRYRPYISSRRHGSRKAPAPVRK